MQSDMENQVYHIQWLLADKLDNYKEKGNKYTDRHIKEIQDTYKQEDIVMKEQDNKVKQKIQDEEVFLYKSYKVDLLRPKTPKLIFI